MINIHPIERIIKNFFISKFKKKYVSELYLEKKKREFLDLKQNGMFVVEYEHEFLQMSRYVKELITSKVDMC